MRGSGRSRRIRTNRILRLRRPPERSWTRRRRDLGRRRRGTERRRLNKRTSMIFPRRY